jgi:hypothetical protein
LAQKELLKAWETASPAEVRSALAAFYTNHGNPAARLLQPDDLVDFGDWLFSTDHINVEYGLLYEGVELTRLSPGSRGVVLLTLYLAVDEWDRRPLVIDQPEENLDPHSVYTELVTFFRAAAARRQVILVTHNANLVVNADSDQVIVARSHRESPAGLPRFSYIAGGLEDSTIREAVCNLLEGGREAFERRRRRYA